MNSREITAIVEPDEDGTVHVPVPPELRTGRFKVTAWLEPVDESGRPLPATPEMIERRAEALEAVRKANPFRGIKDPVEWQREIRKDRPLPGRD